MVMNNMIDITSTFKPPLMPSNTKPNTMRVETSAEKLKRLLVINVHSNLEAFNEFGQSQEGMDSSLVT